MDRWIEAIRRLARASQARVPEGNVPKGSAQAVLEETTTMLPLKTLFDTAPEHTRPGPQTQQG